MRNIRPNFVYNHNKIMNAYQLFKANQSLFRLMNRNGINIEWFSYVDFYEDYLKLKKQDLGKSYIVVYLSEKYKLGERHVWRMLKRLEKEIEFI